MLLAPPARLVMQIKPPQERAPEHMYLVGLENSHDKFARMSAWWWSEGKPFLGPVPACSAPRGCNCLTPSLSDAWD